MPSTRSLPVDNDDEGAVPSYSIEGETHPSRRLTGSIVDLRVRLVDGVPDGTVLDAIASVLRASDIVLSCEGHEVEVALAGTTKGDIEGVVIPRLRDTLGHREIKCWFRFPGTLEESSLAGMIRDLQGEEPEEEDLPLTAGGDPRRKGGRIVDLRVFLVEREPDEEAVRSIESALRSTDAVIAYEGQEIEVALTGTSPEEIERFVLPRVRGILGNQVLFEVEGWRESNRSSDSA